MSEKLTFRAVIENPGGGGAFVRIPFDVEQVFGKKRVNILADIEGVPYRGVLVRMGEPCHILIILKNIREKIGKSFGDEVEVSLEEDTQPREVVIPADLSVLLDENPQAASFFHSLSYTHRKEYVNWITSARQEATHQRRLARTIQMLIDGIKAP